MRIPSENINAEQDVQVCLGRICDVARQLFNECGVKHGLFHVTKHLFMWLKH